MQEQQSNLELGKRTPESSPTDSLSDRDRHRFLAYLIPQLEPLRQACEHNWLTQAGLIALAGFHLYNISKPIVVFGMTFPNEALDVAFPLVLTYLVIRLGYLLNAYIFIRTGIINALSKFTCRPAEFQDDNAERMLRANSLVELFCLDLKWERRRKHNPALLILPLILSAIFALNHILAVLYLGRIAAYALGLAILLAAVLGFAMMWCYVHFYFNADKRSAKLISVATVVFSVAEYFPVHKLLYGSY